MRSERLPRMAPAGLTMGLLIMVLIGSGCLVTHDLQTRRYVTTPLTNARTDQILTDMGTILQNVDSPGDVACRVAFERDGNVTTFNTGTGSINSQADFQAVNGLPGNVKVVNQINWCGSLAPNIIGCAPVPGSSLVVVRYILNREGILWVHEFGHNKGLSHRNGITLVMNPTIGTTQRGINQAECDSYRQK